MPVLTVEQAEAFSAHLRRGGQRLVVTDGTFDLLLPAHVRALESARAHGDALLVLVHSDRSVPETATLLTPENERAEIVAALACVDAAAVISASELSTAVDRLAAATRIPSLDHVLQDPESVTLIRRTRGR